MKQRHEQQQVILDMPGYEKIVEDVFSAVRAELGGVFGRADELPDPVSRSLYGVRQNTRVFVGDLQRYASNRPRNSRLCLPQRLGYGQTKALSQRLLEDDGRSPLQRVDLNVAGRGQEKREDIPDFLGFLFNALHNHLSLRVVRGAAAGQNQLHIDMRLGHPVGLDDSQRVLQVVEPGNLRHHRPRSVDPKPLKYRVDRLLRQLLVLVAQRVD